MINFRTNFSDRSCRIGDMSPRKHGGDDDSRHILSKFDIKWYNMATRSDAVLDPMVQLHSATDTTHRILETCAITWLGNHRIRSLHWIHCDHIMDGLLFGGRCNNF